MHKDKHKNYSSIMQRNTHKMSTWSLLQQGLHYLPSQVTNVAQCDTQSPAAQGFPRHSPNHGSQHTRHFMFTWGLLSAVSRFSSTSLPCACITLLGSNPRFLSATTSRRNITSHIPHSFPSKNPEIVIACSSILVEPLSLLASLLRPRGSGILLVCTCTMLLWVKVWRCATPGIG